MSHLALQEVNEFVEQYQISNPKPWAKQGQQLYDNLMQFIDSNGFDGRYDSKSLIDYASFGPKLEPNDEQQYFKQYAGSKEMLELIPNYFETDLVLQAAWNNIFDIDSEQMNLQMMCAEFYGTMD